MEHSSDGNAKKDLIELNIRMGEAEKERQEGFLKRVLADDLIFRRASGKVVNKKEYLEDLLKPDNTYEYLISEDVNPTVYEDVAVVTLRVRAKGKRGTSSFEGIYRNIRLFLKNQEWHCVVWFNTPIKSN